MVVVRFVSRQSAKRARERMKKGRRRRLQKTLTGSCSRKLQTELVSEIETFRLTTRESVPLPAAALGAMEAKGGRADAALTLSRRSRTLVGVANDAALCSRS